MIRVLLPYHLRALANVSREVTLTLDGPVTISAVLDALEEQYPTLRGTIRDHKSRQRRAFIRFFACGQDWSHEPEDAVLPEDVRNGEEVFRIVGAMAGG